MAASDVPLRVALCGTARQHFSSASPNAALAAATVSVLPSLSPSLLPSLSLLDKPLPSSYSPEAKTGAITKRWRWLRRCEGVRCPGVTALCRTSDPTPVPYGRTTAAEPGPPRSLLPPPLPPSLKALALEVEI